MAYAMVSVYGLSAKVGNISYYDSSGQQSGFTKPYSEERAQLIDKEVSQILEQQYQRAKDILLTHKEKVNKLGSELLENEVIFKNDLTKIFGEREWKSYEEEQLVKLDKEKEASEKKTKAAVKKTAPKKDNGEKLD
jgi:cell division protease FtsH